MGIKLPRKKERSAITFIFRLQKLLPLSHKAKFKLFLNLEWIFDRLSHEESFKNYSNEKHPFRIFSKEFILQNIKATDTVLDLGCNAGHVSGFISLVAKEVVGIDHDQKAIESAKQLYKSNNLTFIHGDALEFLTANKKKFDVLILSHILEHIDEPKDFLLKFKPQFEHIYIELPDFERYYLNNYRKDLSMRLIYSDGDHVSEFDRDELKTILNECGITVEKAEYRHGMQRLWCRTV